MPVASPSRSDELRRVSREVTAAFLRGDRPSLADWQRRYPDLAQELEELFQKTVRLRMESESASLETTATPRELGDYRIIREIGRGGMGVVYEAIQRSLGRRVALKILPPHIAHDGQALERFRREARSAAQLHHTNIVPVFDIGQEGDTCFYAMQFIAGQTFDQRLAEWRALDSINASPALAERCREVARLGEDVAKALAYAHERGIIHRDIKPSNLLLDDAGLVWISDFGLAKSGGDSVTLSGDILGTLRYMAPERFHGWCDQRADIYALGLTLYEALLLQPAYPSRDHVQVMDQVQHQDPPRPRSLVPALPRDLETIIIKAIDKDPERRYQNAGELAEDLRRFQADEPILARPAGPIERLFRAARRNPRLTVLTAAIVLLTVTLIIGALASAVSFRNLAEQERLQADQAAAARDAAQTEARRANEQTETAHEISTFLLGLLEEADPLALAGRGLGKRRLGDRRWTPLEMLDQAAQKLKTTLRDKPAVRAALLAKVGAIYVSFGKFALARPHLDEALSLRQQLHQGDHAELAESWHQLGYFHHAQLQHLDADQAYSKALAMRRRLFGEDHPLVGESLLHLGFLKAQSPSSPEAEPMLRAALKIQARHFGKNSREYGMCLVALLQWFYVRNEVDKMLPLVAEGEALARSLVGSQPAGTINDFFQAQLARKLGLPSRAVELYRRALASAGPWLGDTHFFVMLGRKELLTLLHDELRDLPAAEHECRLVVERLKQQHEETSGEAGFWLLHLGRVLRDQKKYDEAETVLRQAAVIGRAEKNAGRCLHVLGEVLTKSGKIAEAEPILEEAVAARRANARDSFYWYGAVVDDYVSVLLWLNKKSKAAAVLREHVVALDGQANPDGRDHFRQASRRGRLCGLLAQQPADADFLETTAIKAITSLRLAVEAGYMNGRPLDAHPAFRSLRERPEFQDLVAKSKSGTPGKK